jgi:hypothetical protein
MTHDTSVIADLDRCELAAILAGLRLLQAAPTLPHAIQAIATDCGDFERLDAAEIDDLCERINTPSAYSRRDVSQPATAADIAAVAEEERAGEAFDMQMRDRAYFAGGV